ncbi:MAG: bifunctional DNA-formamidopyrimidine glycosylase/DNA-(apurinic or apyrimidinic site) lyase [Actinomycetota bacterium]
MPELPEVEIIRRDLDKEVVGRKIRFAEVRSTRNAMRVIRHHGRRKEFEDRLTGARIEGVSRRGKYLMIELSGGNVLLVHLGMSGQLLLVKATAEFENHTHVSLRLTGSVDLRYVDPRAFGALFVVGRDELPGLKEFHKLGLDPLDQPLTWRYFSETLVQRRAKMKSLLMDQRFICGIGNIYSDEILFVSGLRHDRLSDTLSDQEVRRLYRAIQEVLQEAIRERGTSADDEQYRDLFGVVGGYQKLLRVYQREGAACRRCRTPIQRARWSNRSTFFCPQCQV